MQRTQTDPAPANTVSHPGAATLVLTGVKVEKKPSPQFTVSVKNVKETYVRVPNLLDRSRLYGYTEKSVGNKPSSTRGSGKYGRTSSSLKA